MTRPAAGMGARALRRPLGDEVLPDGSPAIHLEQDALCRECRRVLRRGELVRVLRPRGGMGGGTPTVFCSTACRTVYIEATS